MNNALIVDFQEDSTDESRMELLRERDSRLVRLIEAIDGLIQSPEWRTLKELEFDDVLASLEKRLVTEAGKTEVDTSALYRLQGELKWARRFSDLSALRNQYHTELLGVRRIIGGN